MISSERYSYVGLHHRLGSSDKWPNTLYNPQKKQSFYRTTNQRERYNDCIHVLFEHFWNGKMQDSGQQISMEKKLARIGDASKKTTAVPCWKSHCTRVENIKFGKHVTHQSPILGDRRYGHAGTLAQRLCLYAHHLSFVHPQSREHISITSPIPTLMQRYVDRIL